MADSAPRPGIYEISTCKLPTMDLNSWQCKHLQACASYICNQYAHQIQHGAQNFPAQNRCNLKFCVKSTKMCIKKDVGMHDKKKHRSFRQTFYGKYAPALARCFAGYKLVAGMHIHVNNLTPKELERLCHTVRRFAFKHARREIAVWKTVLCNEPLTVAQEKTYIIFFTKIDAEWLKKNSTDQLFLDDSESL